MTGPAAEHEHRRRNATRLVERIRASAPFRNRNGRPAVLGEVLLLLLGFLVFSRLHTAAGQDVAATATANALALQKVESALHLTVELATNRWLTDHPALIQPAVYYYRLYYVVVVGVLVWTYLRHTDVYLKARRTLLAMITLVLPVFWALPMAPPRLALPGIVDIIAENDILSVRTSGQNQYSAMPSLHVGWSMWCAYVAWSALRTSHPRWALLPWLFPLGMVVTVFITGNHYVLDVVGSVVLLAVSIATATAWGRFAERRPGR